MQKMIILISNIMNKILLITTRGCEGCAAMRNSIKQALALTSKEVIFEERDISDLDKKDANNYRLRDFPTTLFFKDSRLVRKETCSRPYIAVLRWIDVDFK